MKRFYPDQPIIGVGAVIICDGEFLLEKRKSEPGRGKWSIPGGLVELGERLEETVVREVREETDLQVESPVLVDVFNEIRVDEDGRIRYHFVIVDYFVKLKSRVFKASSDADELRWVPLDEVEKYDLTRTFRAFFEKNKEKLEKLNSCT